MVPRHTILVVDDEPNVVRSVQDLLRREYKVLGATSAAEAMNIVREHEVHIVMTDQRMPETTGVEFLSKLRGEHPEAIRLLFTGHADIKAVIEAINQGNVFRYLAKPWDPDELRSVIRQAADHYDLIVEKKRLMAELQANNAELESANAKLRAADALRSAFIKVASHELRTPITIVLGLADLAGRSPPDDPKLRDWLQRIERGGQRLKKLVDQLTKMLSANQFDRILVKQPADLAALLRETADEVLPFVEIRRQRLETDLADDLTNVPIDQEKVRDLVGHLLLNAIKFTPDGGTIRMSAERTSDDSVAIRVEDEGPGIDPAFLPHLFTPFFTGLDVSRHCSGHFELGRKGLGLGLSIVRSFAEMHGGRVEHVAKQGRGATFVVTLPGRSG